MARIEAYARPGRLYRYRPLTDRTIERELKAIREGYIFCPHFDEMNDPMEGSHRASVLLRKSKNYSTTLEEVQRHLKKLGIASFAEIHDHETMWAHYASQFAGICISYSLRGLLKNLPDDHELVRMNYTEAPPILLRNSESAELKAKLILSNKTLRWGSEREWRLLRPSRGRAPYDRIDTVTRIYLGAKIAIDHRRQISLVLRKLDIPLFEMQVNQYQLGFSKVSKKRV